MGDPNGYEIVDDLTFEKSLRDLDDPKILDDWLQTVGDIIKGAAADETTQFDGLDIFKQKQVTDVNNNDNVDVDDSAFYEEVQKCMLEMHDDGMGLVTCYEAFDGDTNEFFKSIGLDGDVGGDVDKRGVFKDEYGDIAESMLTLPPFGNTFDTFDIVDSCYAKERNLNVDPFPNFPEPITVGDEELNQVGSTPPENDGHPWWKVCGVEDNSRDFSVVNRYIEAIEFTRGELLVMKDAYVPVTYSGPIATTDRKMDETPTVNITQMLPHELWVKEFLHFVIPNNITTVSKCIEVFSDFCNRNGSVPWKYALNTETQPHTNAKSKCIPLRFSAQIGNFYEPFIIRMIRIDGSIVSDEEIAMKMDHRRGSVSNNMQYLVEGLCPYCQISEACNPDDYFYSKLSSEYLHHVVNHHAVFSNGCEMEMPQFIGCNDNGQYFAKCPECPTLCRIRSLVGVGMKVKVKYKDFNPFLGYMRHVVAKHYVGKKSDGISNVDRYWNIVDIAEEQVYFDDGF